MFFRAVVTNADCSLRFGAKLTFPSLLSVFTYPIAGSGDKQSHEAALEQVWLAVYVTMAMSRVSPEVTWLRWNPISLHRAALHQTLLKSHLFCP